MSAPGDAQGDHDSFLFDRFYAGIGPFHRNIGSIEIDDRAVLDCFLVELQRISDGTSDNLADLLPGDSDSRNGCDGIDHLILSHSAKIQVDDLGSDIADVMTVLRKELSLEVFVSGPRNLISSLRGRFSPFLCNSRSWNRSHPYRRSPPGKSMNSSPITFEQHLEPDPESVVYGAGKVIDVPLDVTVIHSLIHQFAEARIVSGKDALSSLSLSWQFCCILFMAAISFVFV